MAALILALIPPPVKHPDIFTSQYPINVVNYMLVIYEQPAIDLYRNRNDLKNLQF